MIIPCPALTGFFGITFLLTVGPTRAGQCWSVMHRTGRCTESLRTNVTREECCSDGSATTAWSPMDLRSGDLFFWRTLGGGVVCIACKVSCEGVECGKGLRCVLRKGRPACVCSPKCSRKKRLMGEVCGSDGRTYKHFCRLMKKQCRKNKQLTVEYVGKCQKSCDKVHCTGRKTCLLDQVLRPHCVKCQGHCPPGLPGGYVCGADNITYSSYCNIRRAACIKGKAVPEAYRGKCKAGATCDNIRCGQNKRCLVNPSGGPPRCVSCPKQCRNFSKTDRLCATNNYTYATWCHMMEDACKHGVILEAKKEGPCEESETQQTNIIPLHVPGIHERF